MSKEKRFIPTTDDVHVLVVKPNERDFELVNCKYDIILKGFYTIDIIENSEEIHLERDVTVKEMEIINSLVNKLNN